MTWQSNFLKFLEKEKGLNGTCGWVEHRTHNDWDMLCHYWTFANTELFIKLCQAVLEYSERSRYYQYYVSIGCTFPVEHGPHHKRKHYFSIHRFPKNDTARKIIDDRRMARLLCRKAGGKRQAVDRRGEQALSA